MPRSRLGVAILFDAETTAEIDGLRRGLGEPDRGRIPPHLTVIPPTNVRDVDAARRVVRAAAQSVRPLEIVLGPVETFLPTNPVAYLRVAGDADGVRRLQAATHNPPLDHPLTWPYVPHVTVVDGVDPERIAATPALLASFEKPVTVGSVSLLEEQGRRWVPIGTYPLGPPAVIGRGGAPIELDVVDVDGDVTITAYAEGEVVGHASGWRHESTARLRELQVIDAYRDEADHHLMAAFRSWAADHDATVLADSVDT